MDERLEKYKRKAKRKAREYLIIKRSYKTKEEKKAFRIAEKLRVQVWLESLAALDAEEREVQLKAYKVYRATLEMKQRIITAAVLAAAVVVIGLGVLL